MKILASEKLSQHKFKDNHGYLICTDCIMARTGKQTYTRDDCFGDGDMTEIEVDRPEKEVFDPKTLASFENVPITIEHPENNVDSDNYNSLAVGYMRDIHKGMYQGQPVMLGTAVITDSEGIEKVESGELTNLSCGYDCDIEDDKNPKQTNIRGNHIALCEIPRAGITRIQDSIRETRNPKKRAFLDSLARNHISYVEKDPNRFTFLTDDIGKAKRLARQIVGNNFLEDRDTLAIDFYKERNNKMKKDSQGSDWTEWTDSKDTFIRDKRRTRDDRTSEHTWELPQGLELKLFEDDRYSEPGWGIYNRDKRSRNVGTGDTLTISSDGYIYYPEGLADYMSNRTKAIIRQIISNYMGKEIKEFEDSVCKDDIVKQGKGWTNKGKEGTHGHFRTKKEAREQQKAMFARGYKADDSIVICADSYEEAVRKYKRRLRNRF